MNRTHTGRPSARLSTLIAGGALAALALTPGAARAQSDLPPGPLDAGVLAYSVSGAGEGHDGVRSIWRDGTHRRALSPAGHVGSWDKDGGVVLIARADGTIIPTDVTGSGSGVGNDATGERAYPAYSQDRTYIAFARQGLWIGLSESPADADLVEDYDVGRIGWSSQSLDGTLVWERKGAGVRVSHNRGADSVPLASDPNAEQPSISQTGTHVAYVSEGETGTEIRVSPTDWGEIPPFAPTSPTTAVPATSDRVNSMPAISPDGSQVAFVSETGGVARIFIAPADGSEEPVAVPSTATEGDITGLAWQPVAQATAGTPTVSGQAKVGETLTATPGADTGSQPLTSTQAWQRCPVGDLEGCVDIGGATSTTYEVTADDVGKQLRFVQRAVNPARAHQAQSAVTATVEAGLAPAPTLTEHPGVLSNKLWEVFEFTGTGPGSQFVCKVDDKPWNGCRSGDDTETIHDNYFLTEGPHTFSVAEYLNGKIGEAATWAWTTDLTPPGRPVIGEWPSPKKTFATITWTGDEGVRYECLVKGGGTVVHPETAGPAWEKCASPLLLDELADGDHHVTVVAYDPAGNPSEQAHVMWTVDTEAPAAPEVTAAPPATTTDTAAVIEFTGEERATFEYRLDGGEWKKAKSPLKLAGLALGAHTLVLRQTDFAGHVGAERTVTWTVVEPAKPVETPAPVATPEPTPTPAPAPAPKPKFTATVENKETGKGDQSGAATVTVERKAVDVGCQMTGVALSSCEVELYATVDSDGRVVASGRVLVGKGHVEADARTNKLAVRVVLNATGRELLRKNPQGLDVQVAITGKPVSGAPIEATGTARLVAKRSTVVIGGFDVNSPKLSTAAKRRLERLAKQLAGGATVKITGHTDGSTDAKRYLRDLGKDRATAVKRFLKAHGAKATYTLATKADTRPRASNATKHGRALNRRVVLQIVR